MWEVERNVCLIPHTTRVERSEEKSIFVAQLCKRENIWRSLCIAISDCRFQFTVLSFNKILSALHLRKFIFITKLFGELRDKTFLHTRNYSIRLTKFLSRHWKQILNEIENKDITITPIRQQQNINFKKRKASDSIIITSNTQLVPPSTTPTSVVSLPITIRTKDDHQQVDELINIKLEPFEELLTNNTQLRSSADITVQEILDWAKTFKIPQSAVNELLHILKIKRIKTEIKSETTPKLTDGAATTSLQQRKTRQFKNIFAFSISFDEASLDSNLFFSTLFPATNLVSIFVCFSLETVGLFSKVFQRLEGMERNLMSRMVTLERKVDMKNLQQLKVQNSNQPSPQPKWETTPLAVTPRRPEQTQKFYKIVRTVN